METHGKWTRFSALGDLAALPGHVLDRVEPIQRTAEKLVGVVIGFTGGASLVIEVAFDELLVSTASGAER